MSGNTTLNTLTSLYNSSFTRYLQYSETIGGVIFDQSVYVDNVFKSTLELVKNCGRYSKPLNPLVERCLLDKLLQEIHQVAIFETKTSGHIFQITLISKSIKIFEWVRELDTEKFVNQLRKYVHFYQQRAQCEIEVLTRTHFEWLKYWNETYEELSVFIVNFFKNGITWSGTESLPLNYELGDSPITYRTEDRQALLNDINKGENVKNALRYHSTLDEQVPLSKGFSKVDQKWVIQSQKGSHKDLVLNTAIKEDDICIYNCEECTIVIENLVNTIYLDTCRTVSILFRNAVKLEATNCEDCNLHCFEKVIDMNMIACINCGLYLSDRSLGTTIVTTNCTEINVNFPFEDGIYKNFKISDQLITKILQNIGIETTVKNN